MESHYRSDRYQVIPNGIDVRVPADDPYEKEPVILLIGRMQESKNFQTALRALGLIGAKGLAGWRVEAAGDGPCRQRLEQLTDRLGLRECVTFRGWLDHGSELHSALVNSAAVFISASRFENCPVAVLESAAAGSTLILSDISGHHLTGVDGIRYFPADDPAALAAILRGELKKQPVRRTYDLRAYSWDTVTAAYETLLSGCAASGPLKR